ncbi:MAG: regulatory protein RecX [Actinomycetota bacterium]|nr:regulatory protein RecX [Actinomycetota bacterium]
MPNKGVPGGLDEAKNYALRLLSHRARSVQEMRERLARKGHPEKVVDKVLSSLKKSNYLDDISFTKIWVENRVSLRGYGQRRIRAELISKGIEKDLVERELDESYPEEKEKEVALTLAKKRLPSYRGLAITAARRRLIQFLLRRGFSSETAQEVCRELLPER